MRKSKIVSFALALSLLPAAYAAPADPLVVRTDKGTLAGKSSDDGAVRIFLGVPYAAPPVGALRWKPPVPASPWQGTRSAQSYGSHCFQANKFPDMTFHDPGESEDCLTLNVWAPANVPAGTRLPVMVWVYGGGFAAGSTSEARQDGAALARKGVILVSMNYRLNIFGFFAHSALAAESPRHAAGNYGLMDQAAALQWVRANIAAFGGDPANVTLFGESAGSYSVSAQMASPLAKDTLAHAIGESGAAFSSTGLSFPALPAAEAASDAFATSIGKSSLAELRAMSAPELVQAIEHQGGTPARFGPDVDGLFMPEPVAAIYAAGRQAHIPIIAGWNRDEGGLPKTPATLASYREQARTTWGSRADAFLRAYPATTDAEALRATADYDADRFIGDSTWEWAEAQTLTGTAPVYRYHFEQLSPGSRYHPASSGVFHSSEIEYVFGNLAARPAAPWTEADYQLSDLIQNYWVNFAKNGNPNGPGLPQWLPYSSDHQVMRLDTNSASSPDTTHDRYLFLRNAQH